METERMERIRQELIEAWIEMIPVEWDKLKMQAFYHEGEAWNIFYIFPSDEEQVIPSVEMIYYYDLDHEEWTAKEELLDEKVRALAEEFKAEGRQPFTSVVLIIEEDNKLKVEYSYDKLKTLDPIRQEQEFAKKYVHPEFPDRRKKFRPDESEGVLKKVFGLFFK